MELQAILWREENMYVIKEVVTGVTTQGKTIEEAIELYLEEMPEMLEELKSRKALGAVRVEIA
jgi:predicted RNase H-like HicB family nuclease